ncbi:hypothetical protein [Caulobacter sp. NIBR1757]|uniref:hypothetical protein n=1 Tax=Caulobacter sp. NIBR1757 TaxID=3016000 RepID=UPI0022F0FA3F|nr:hypothetical protein [Caulobacter sp. NIBR1757]WGM37555.1 hypothetical protein AMEJIAPC_00454 [Caulobacter sp. NIBR1757]
MGRIYWGYSGSMSDSGRRRKFTPLEAIFSLVAALCAVLLVGMLASHMGEQRGRENAAAAYRREGVGKSIPLVCARGTPVEIADCVHKEVVALVDQSHDQQDLNVQEQLALFSLMALILSAVTTGATIWALLYVRGTLEATREAVEDTGRATSAVLEANAIARASLEGAKRTAETQLRAWMGSESTITGLMIGDDGKPWGVGFRTHWKNVGQTPALNAGGSMRLLRVPPDFDTEGPELLDPVDRNDHLSFAAPGQGIGTGPATMTIAELRDLAEGRTRFILRVWVFYNDFFSDTRHVSEVTAELFPAQLRLWELEEGKVPQIEMRMVSKYNRST